MLAKLVCLLAPESKGEILTNLWIPDSFLSQPKTYSPSILIVEDLIPASSPLCSLIKVDLNFLISDHFKYILLNMSAQSWLSVPPAPAWISI